MSRSSHRSRTRSKLKTWIWRKGPIICYLHSPTPNSTHYSYSKVPLELLFPTTEGGSYFLKSYVFCSANSVPLYLLLLTSALHFNSYILLDFQLIPKSKLLAYKRRARCVAVKHGKVSRKHSNSYDIGALSPNTRY